MTCGATRKTTQDDLDFGSILNIAQVWAEGPGGDADEPGDDVTAVADASVAVEVSTGLRVQVEVDRDPVVVGSRASWAFTAINTGNVTLTDVGMKNPLQRRPPLACRPWAGWSLAPGDQMVCTGRYTPTGSGGDRGRLSVTVAVRARAPYDDPTVGTDDVVATATPTVTVRKAVATPTTTEGGLLGTGPG